MKVLVTGASGFLGGHVVHSLVEAGHTVRALVRPTSDVRDLAGIALAQGDLDAQTGLTAATAGMDAVVHCAAKVDDAGSYEAFARTNLAGTEALLRAARASGVRRFVFVSSPSVVMDGRDQVRIDESTPYPSRYLHPYAKTKALAEQAVHAAHGDAMQTISLRPRGIWGPGDWSGPIPRLLDRMARGRLPDLSGGRRVLADMCFVTSAAWACVLAVQAERVHGRACFVTDDAPVDVWAFARELAARYRLPPPGRALDPRAARGLARSVEAFYRLPLLRDRSPPLSRYGIALIANTHTYDISAARRDLGYAPLVDREEALAVWFDWIEDQGGIGAFLAGVSG